MASKKGKKNKGKTLALFDFLQETPGAVPSMPVRKSTLNWADEVEDNHDSYESRSAKVSVVLPTAPKASRDFDDIIDKVPQDPPFIAYLSNLPYDVDENEIEFFFKHLKIANMRIPKDDRPGEVPRLRGFGYIEFEDRESLLSALLISDTTIKNRRMRIEVASDYDDKRRNNRSDMNRDRGNRPDVSTGDWRSGPRTETLDNNNDRRGGFGRDRERDRDDSSTSTWRDGDRRSNRDSDRPFTRSDKFSRDDKDDFSRSRGREDRDVEITRSKIRDDKDSDFSRSRGRDDRDNDFRGRGRDDRDDFNRPRIDRERDDKFMSRRYDDKGKGGGFSRREESEKESSEPRQRPKLVLAPRTKPVEAAVAEPVAAPSIFGNAKPVDTSARERQIEERLAKATDPPPTTQRELSRERKDSPRDNDRSRERKDREKIPEFEKKSAEKSSSQAQKTEANGLIEKNNHQSRKNGEEKREVTKPEGNEKHKEPKDNRKQRDDKKERLEKEMPKLKKQEPPNFVASNKFAFLQADEDNSD